VFPVVLNIQHTRGFFLDKFLIRIRGALIKPAILWLEMNAVASGLISSVLWTSQAFNQKSESNHRQQVWISCLSISVHHI